MRQDEVTAPTRHTHRHIHAVKMVLRHACSTEHEKQGVFGPHVSLTWLTSCLIKEKDRQHKCLSDVRGVSLTFRDIYECVSVLMTSFKDNLEDV